MYGPRGMDRDRDRRPREIPPEDQYGSGRGQSYRPGNVRERTPPPRMDSYRARSPPRRSEFVDSYTSDSYRGPRARSRTPPRRDDFRRRSPSLPRFRDREPIPRGGDSYRARPRSPPVRREELPRDDLFRREPARNERDFRDTRDFRDERDRGFPNAARSPAPRFRDRSPLPAKTGRDPSPISSRGRRTPPPSKRDRIATPPRGRFDAFPPSRGITSPRRRPSPEQRDRRSSLPRSATRDQRARSRSPLPRGDKFDGRGIDDRRRLRSPPREQRTDHNYASREDAARSTGPITNTRPSSPISRMLPPQPPSTTEDRTTPSKDVGAGRDTQRDRELSNRRSESIAKSEPTVLTDRTQSAQREQIASTSQPPQTPTPNRENSRDETPPSRPPPTGPRAAASGSAPPMGPSIAISTPPTSQTRAPGPPPSGPRGLSSSRGDYPSRGRGGFGGEFGTRGRGGFSSSYRGGRGGASSTTAGAGAGSGAGSGRAEPQTDTPFTPRAPPSGPRNSFAQPAAPILRSTSSSSVTSTFQRPNRFSSIGSGDGVLSEAGPTAGPPTGPKASRRMTDLAASHALTSANSASAPSRRTHAALMDLPKIIEGGLRAEPIVDRAKLSRLEDEAEKLRKQVDEKDARRRKSLREWDRLARETEIASLRSELAEQALRALNGEMESQAAF